MRITPNSQTRLESRLLGLKQVAVTTHPASVPYWRRDLVGKGLTIPKWQRLLGWIHSLRQANHHPEKCKKQQHFFFPRARTRNVVV